MVSKSSDSATILVLQELEIVEHAITRGETGKDLIPSGLVLVAMRELDVGVLKREGVFRKLLETEDDVVGGSGGPGSFWDQLETHVGEFRIGENALCRSLNQDFVTCVGKSFGGGGGY